MVSFYNPTECFSVERKKVHKKRTSYSNDKFNPLIVRILAQVGTFLYNVGLPQLLRSFVSPLL